MKIRTEYFSRKLLSLSCLGFIACSSLSPKVEIPKGSDPQKELAATEAQLQQEKRLHYDALSPQRFENAEKSLESARKRIAKGDDSDKILNDIGEARGSLNGVHTTGEIQGANFAPVIRARQAAMEAQAPALVKDDFKSAVIAFKDVGRDIEGGKFELKAQTLAKLEKRYSEVELSAVKTKNLGEARSLIEQAENNNAERHAPQTFELAKSKYASAIQTIEANRRNPQGYQAIVGESVRSARKLNEVTTIAKASKINEAAALKLWNQQQQISGQQQQIAGQQDALANSSAAAAQLQSQMTEGENAQAVLQAKNQQYANKEAVNQKIAEIKKEIGAQNAEILRDGNDIVVRMKSGNFPSARAEINPTSLDTLEKVKGLIEVVPGSRVIVEGHTDSIGTAETNKVLSEKRAESIKEYFVSQRIVAPESIEAVGYGFDKPLRSNKSKEGRAMNRRVDIVIKPQAQES